MISVKYPYVVEDVDRHGNVRIYFRRKGQRKSGSSPNRDRQSSLRSTRNYLRRAKPGSSVPARKTAPQPGTLRWLVTAYVNSADFKRLDPDTQKTRRGILENCLLEPIAPTHRASRCIG